jgi:hypothetical protein
VRRLLARHGLPFAHHTAVGIVGLAAFTATHRDAVERARTVADTAGQANASANILIVNAYAALAGYATGDVELLERLGAWQAAAEAALAAEVRATKTPASLEGPALNVHWARAVVEGRFDDAISLLRFAHERCPTAPAGRSYLLVPLATRLLAAGERDELDALVEIFATDLLASLTRHCRPPICTTCVPSSPAPTATSTAHGTTPTMRSTSRARSSPPADYR